MIVWLASYPRSGNTFFRLLLHHQYGVKTYSLYNDPLFDQIGAADAIGHERLPAPLPELEADGKIHFVKTHDLPLDDKPAIYLVRDGRDSVVSFARYLRSFTRPRGRWGKLANFVRERILGQILFQRTLKEVIVKSHRFGGWSENVFGWLRQPVGRTALVRYEDLVADPVGVLRKAIAELHIGLKPISNHVPSFEELHAQWPTFFRKGQVGAWREEMPDRLQRLFWEKHGDAMRQLGYAA